MRENRWRSNSVSVLVALLLLVPLFAVNVAASPTVPDQPTNLKADGDNAKVILNWTPRSTTAVPQSTGTWCTRAVHRSP